MGHQMQDLVVVITGASSGIGRATALAFARRGAALVVAARREQLLQDLIRECERVGGRGVAVPTDVTDEQAVQELARRAIQSFGRIDVWVNNAAVGLFARFEEAPLADYRQVIETNVFGYIYGARAALPLFREQGKGVLINVDSIVGAIPQPYTSAYGMSKHAVRALSMSLRQELLLDGLKSIHVCNVMPATIDTPFFQHAANYTGRATKAMPPVYSAERVAETIVSLVEQPKREALVGHAGRMFNLIRVVAPGLAERMMARQVDKQHLYQHKPADATSGNLFEPMSEGAGVEGGWHGSSSERARRVATGMAAVVPAWLTWRWYQHRRAAKRGFFARMAARMTG